MRTKNYQSKAVNYTEIVDDGKSIKISTCFCTVNSRFKNAVHYFLHFHGQYGGQILAMTSTVLVVDYFGKKITYIAEPKN